jgi:GH25 family lysozyme M1 (1,4-beta-N-acetylmuramidase)
MILPDCIIVDISHWQAPGSIDWKTAHDKGNVHGAIVKLIQNGVPDPAHVQHLYDAYEGGIELLGMYDFGTAQEDHAVFLTEALAEFNQNVDKVLLALDAEKSSSQMTVPDAEAWSTGVQESRGVWPKLYMGIDGPDGTGAGLPSQILSKSSLWLPAYGPHENDLGTRLPRGFRLPQNDTESEGVVRLWQFTGDGINAPANWPPGLPPNLDLSYALFSSFDALSAWWGT